jgi:hypothetical protein
MSITFFSFWFLPPVEYGSEVSSDIKWFQLPPDRSCGRSNPGPPYQVQRQFIQLKFIEFFIKVMAS